MKLVLVALTFVLCVVTSLPTYCADTSIEDELATRGLIGSAVGYLRANARIPDPAGGAAVSEITANLASGGDHATRAMMWEEVIADRRAEFTIDGRWSRVPNTNP